MVPLIKIGNNVFPAKLTGMSSPDKCKGLQRSQTTVEITCCLGSREEVKARNRIPSRLKAGAYLWVKEEQS